MPGIGAKIVASATILNSVRAPPSTQIGTIFGKGPLERHLDRPARGNAGEEVRAARSLQVRAVPAQSPRRRSQPRPLARIPGALRARHSRLAGAGDARLPQGSLQRAI